MIINELFTSINGESKKIGSAATFIRSSGCSLRCKYCDSKYTWGPEDTTREMTCEEILDFCKESGAHDITFTGGEPLLQKDADELINLLSDNGFDVCIETNGAVDFTTRDWFVNNKDNVWVCADYKGLASGMTDKMLPLDKFAKLRERDVLKFVVGSEADLDLARSVISYIREKGSKCLCYLSPVFGMIEPVAIVEYMQKYKMYEGVRAQVQLHKIIWDPNKRLV